MSQSANIVENPEKLPLTDDENAQVKTFKTRLMEIEPTSDDASVFIEQLQSCVIVLLPSVVLSASRPTFQIAIGFVICAVLLVRTGRKYKRNSTVTAANGGKKYRWVCSNSGTPTITDDRVLPLDHEHSTQSTRCGCKAWFSLRDGEFDFHLEHKDECKNVAFDNARVKARTFKQIIELAFPGFEQKLREKAIELLKRDRRLDPKNVKSQMIGEYTEALAGARDRKEISELQLPEVPSNTWIQGIFEDARFEAAGEVSREQSMGTLIRLLMNNPNKYAYRQMNVARGADASTTKALHMWMKEIAPENLSSTCVFTADVTHGVCDSRAGPHRISFISAVDESRNVHPVVFSLIDSEDKDTFMNELLFLQELDPTLRDRDVVFIVDGDRGGIAAIQLMLPRARVFLCMWHKHQNVKKRMVPLLHIKPRILIVTISYGETIKLFSLV